MCSLVQSGRIIHMLDQDGPWREPSDGILATGQLERNPVASTEDSLSISDESARDALLLARRQLNHSIATRISQQRLERAARRVHAVCSSPTVAKASQTCDDFLLSAPPKPLHAKSLDISVIAVQRTGGKCSLQSVTLRANSLAACESGYTTSPFECDRLRATGSGTQEVRIDLQMPRVPPLQIPALARGAFRQHVSLKCAYGH